MDLYLAILLEYILKDSPQEMNIDRDILMSGAKISSRATYNKSIHELHDYGYTKYVPSFSSFLGSMVYLIHW